MKTGQLITAFGWALLTALLASVLTFGIAWTALGHRGATLIAAPSLILLVCFVCFLVVLKDSEGK